MFVIFVFLYAADASADANIDEISKKIDQKIDAVNDTYRAMVKGFSYWSSIPESQPLPEEMEPIPVPLATRIKGHIEVKGKDSDLPATLGYVPLELTYTVRESFLGFMVITKYYDPKTRTYIDKEDYFIGSISTEIEIEPKSLSGKQCVEHVGTLPKDCMDWREFTEYDIDKGDVYPGSYQGVIEGSSDEGRMTIEVESPTIIFRSSDNRATRGLGCFGTKFEKTLSQFREDLESRKLTEVKAVGDDSIVTPRCEIGSTIALNIDFCDPERFADLDKCKQIGLLLDRLKRFIKLRDIYKAAASGAESEEDLETTVDLEMDIAYPGTELWYEEYLKRKTTAYYEDPCNGKIVVPDYCTGSCVPRPLCEWDRKAAEIHEQTHKSDYESDPYIRKLHCETLYQQRCYKANDLAKTKAEIRGKSEGNAYNATAQYIRSVIDEQLSGILDCQLDPRFHGEFKEAINSLEEWEKPVFPELKAVICNDGKFYWCCKPGEACGVFKGQCKAEWPW